MTTKARIIATLALAWAGPFASAQSDPKPQKPAPAKTAITQPATQDHGERAFQANCSRCHNAPEQLSRRITGTVIMHMRVRASLSAQDERDIIHFFAP